MKKIATQFTSEESNLFSEVNLFSIKRFCNVKFRYRLQFKNSHIDASGVDTQWSAREDVLNGLKNNDFKTKIRNPKFKWPKKLLKEIGLLNKFKKN